MTLFRYRFLLFMVTAQFVGAWAIAGLFAAAAGCWFASALFDADPESDAGDA